jgi:hypothetical protein
MEDFAKFGLTIARRMVYIGWRDSPCQELLRRAFEAEVPPVNYDAVGVVRRTNHAASGVAKRASRRLIFILTSDL